ncbi:40S ribosomal protein S24-2, partial [Linum perenne]
LINLPKSCPQCSDHCCSASSFKASSVRVSGVRLTDICIFRSKQQSWRKKKIVIDVHHPSRVSVSKVELKEKLADMHAMMDPHCHLCVQMQDTPPRWKVNSVSIDL